MITPFKRDLGCELRTMQLTNREIESLLPECYSKKKKPNFSPWAADLSRFEERTLFYIFYNVPADLYQMKASS